MNTMRNLATFVTLGRLDDHAPGTCVAWMDSADRVCGKPVDDYLCPRHVKVAERKRDKEVAKEKARREKVAAAAEAKRPAREARLAKIEARLRQIDPFLYDDRPFDHGEQNVPLHKRMPSEARIAELARLHREANSLRQPNGSNHEPRRHPRHRPRDRHPRHHRAPGPAAAARRTQRRAHPAAGATPRTGPCGRRVRVRGRALPEARRRMRHLSLCTGYGGIDLALAATLGAETVAVADVDPGARKVLAHRYPDAPNLGDITRIDWSQWVGAVDVLSGGTPCQDLSHAGRRAGMADGTRSNLWVAMREAVATIRPPLVVWENVRGAYSAAADSALEPCQGCVGDPIVGTPLRALGRVLGDLSTLGYDTFWYGLRAADVGAAHNRYRVFVFAFPADATSDTRRIVHRDNGSAAPDTASCGRDWWARESVGRKGGRAAAAGSGEVPGRMMPTPRTSDTNGAGAHGDGGPDLRTSVALLPTPRAGDGTKGGPNQAGSSGDLMLPSAVQDWREYEPAIRRQEHAFGRPAPTPTEPGPKGNPRLSTRFSEWLMGCPDGWITDTPGITRNEALKLAGNGVVPQQAAAAAAAFVHDMRQERAA